MFYRIIRGILRPIIYLLYRPSIVGLENFPSTGGVILYSNHISLLDPIVIGCMLPRKVYFMAKTELFKSSVFGFILRNLGAFPVKRGTADLAAIRNSLRVLKSGKVFGIFPEGTRNKPGAVQHFSHGAASIAHRSKAKIIPIGITGEYKLFRYRSVKVVIGEAVDMDGYFTQKSSTDLLESMSIKMEESLANLLGDATSV
ncbi:MAG: 1-acyl-sn-glycerol-3-phosphate acyltransferase [Clostridiales bacterium]|nr:1-acyl-sn-glycerol-3-phosphate acyltransferase [Clostridiales bacterium]